jgi:hypothetical protein
VAYDRSKVLYHTVLAIYSMKVDLEYSSRVNKLLAFSFSFIRSTGGKETDSSSFLQCCDSVHNSSASVC